MTMNGMWKGIALCLAISIPSWFLGKMYPIIGGAVIAILAGMLIGQFIKDKKPFADGIKFASKKILQWAVILLGFGLNLNVILKTGQESLPIIISTIATSLIISYILCKVMNIPRKISTLIGVGSSICGGSAVAAAAPVIDADDEEVAQAISVIFFFNVLAALVFPTMGVFLGMSTNSGYGFGVFAGTAVNDTSSVTACAASWDSMWNLGASTLDTAVTVKLTRTLAIIPICLGLSYLRMQEAKREGGAGKSVDIKAIFPMFILYFVLASVITTICTSMGVSSTIFAPIKTTSKFFIVLAMAAIGLNTDIVKLVKCGGKPIVMGFCCWLSITIVSLVMQKYCGIW